jgi:hypothetical protein
MKKVYAFVDASHLIKTVRRAFIDQGLLIKSKKITKKLINFLINENKNEELSSMFKLTDKHTKKEPFSSMKVSLAVELFSHSTLINLKRNEIVKLDEEFEPLCEFLSTINSWWDLFNSIDWNESLKSKRPYGLDLDNQNVVCKKFFP